MTSSLVGSEMCIRDRRVSPRSSLFARPWRSSPGNGPAAGRAGGRIQKPVSYTHLTLPTICSV
eukprot:11843932-Prorocentrum_lima.AAC.1